jgi:hypothetical protein
MEQIKKIKNINEMLSKIQDPVGYFHSHYSGYSSDQLALEDPFLYAKLERKGLLQKVLSFETTNLSFSHSNNLNKKPKNNLNYGHDALTYYHEHFEGKTASEIPSGLYYKLKKENSSFKLPRKRREGKYGHDALTYYHTHFEGKSASEIPQGLYYKLKKEGHSNQIPKRENKNSQKYIPDVLTYYHEHFEGLTRGELKKINHGFLERVRQKGLIEHIPNKSSKYGKDYLEYYHTHYEGLTRKDLSKKDHLFYGILRKNNLLSEIPKSKRITKPSKYGPDYLAYYHEHFEGLTRGQIQKKDNNFYTCLRRNNLLEQIPKKQRQSK